MIKLDVLVCAAHPDDAELGCGGTIISHIQLGKKVGILDFTQGELGTRGTVSIREKEAADASKIMGLSVRENLGLSDGFFKNDKKSQLAVAQIIRKYRPEILLINAPQDRHPDHGRAAQLAIDAGFISGLKAVKTEDESGDQVAWRAKATYHYIQSQYLIPDFVVDISEQWEKKLEAIRAYKSQFFNPESTEENTYISSPEFMKMLNARAKELGHGIGVPYGEGFIKTRMTGLINLFDLI